MQGKTQIVTHSTGAWTLHYQALAGAPMAEVCPKGTLLLLHRLYRAAWRETRGYACGADALVGNENLKALCEEVRVLLDAAKD